MFLSKIILIFGAKIKVPFCKVKHFERFLDNLGMDLRNLNTLFKA